MQIKKQNKYPMACLRDYRDALYSCLVQLNPQFCLEIGTHIGATTEIFCDYFDNFRKDGFLVTGDVKEYRKINNPRVKQVLVKSHLPYEELKKNHDLLEEKDVNYSENSQYINDILFWQQLQKTCKANKFQFIFIDGDHTKKSVEKDFKLSLSLLAEDGYILLDDVPSNLECSEFYYDSIKPKKEFECYEFGDEEWYKGVGAVLIKPSQISN